MSATRAGGACPAKSRQARPERRPAPSGPPRSPPTSSTWPTSTRAAPTASRTRPCDKRRLGPFAHGPARTSPSEQALRSWAIVHGDDEEAADGEIAAREKTCKAITKYAAEQANLHGFQVRKSLEPPTPSSP
ncbi:hypothetical protein [Streptomyces sp. KL116D]|uniref:hypothetical protein n=1 Tax=Streptomyces sp. KL116D TaxID=3045152 RepID=UPI00355795D4